VAERLGERPHGRRTIGFRSAAATPEPMGTEVATYAVSPLHLAVRPARRPAALRWAVRPTLDLPVGEGT